MPNFILAYHGGKIPESPEEGAKVMAAWQAWYGTIGENLVDGGAPVGQSHTVTSAGMEPNGGANPISGYTVIKAASIDEAVEVASRCPMVADGSGSAEVAECMEM